jgi:DNA polymerase-3 subunit alpha
MNDLLKNWMEDNLIEYEIIEQGLYKTGIGVVLLVEDTDCVTSYEDEINLKLSYRTVEDVLDGMIDYIVYKFGEGFYYTPINKITDIDIKEFKWIGEYNGYLPKNDYSRSFIGVHGRYEVMSGTKDYSDWCKKANFLQYNSLAICEKNTLAGTLPFQTACHKANIKPIIGYTAEVECDNGDRYDVKLYCINQESWQDLLIINKIINIDNLKFISQDDLMKLISNLCVVITPGSHVNKSLLVEYKRNAHNVLFQLTTNEYRSEITDGEILDSMKEYVDSMTDIVGCVIISDAYCLEHNNTHVKDILNKQGGVRSSSSTNHYLRSFEEIVWEFEQLFDADDKRFSSIWNQSLKGLEWISENCQFNIDTNTLFLPKYEMTEQEIAKYGTTDKMFDALIDDGRWKKFHDSLWSINQQDAERILDERIAKERDVIARGGFIDYFLILWDIVNWCNKEKIQVGPGRGSAAGCLISYLLGVVKINPMQFGLIFERFLNESRIKSEMPDIDLDFASDRRDEVIAYMQQRYGHDFVCRVGTYGTLQMRGTFKELARAYNYNGEYNLNFITQLVEDNSSWSPIFKNSLSSKVLRNFIQDNPEIINDSKAILNAIKSISMHACATIIVPKRTDSKGNVMSVYEQLPVRMEDGMLVSEWEGDVLADAGFLKEDILSTTQMAKIGHIIDLVEQRTGERLDMEKVPLDDANVYNLFKQGMNQDVFHFGSTGLTTYLKMVKPDNIDELIASIALYRPGAMASNAHINYVRLKKGDQRPIYDYKLQEVTKDTYGLYIYQEQIMQAVQVLGGFTLTEADGVRKAMGKKIVDKMQGYKIQFVDNAVKLGCKLQEAESIWDKLEVFSGYGFNKSHAAAYSVVGYYCNWLKHHYPLEFWTVAFQFAKDDQISGYIGEVHKTGDIHIVAPDINKSEIEFRSNVKDQKIYWNLSSIKFIGTSSAEEIIKERRNNGKYFSMEEFVERTSSSINKRVVENLIMSGCFDEMYKVKKVIDRYGIIEDYYATRKDDIPERFTQNKDVGYFWSIQQNEISKLSNLDYTELILQSMFADNYQQYITSEEFAQMKVSSKKGPVKVISGLIQEIIVRKTKKDRRPYAVIKIHQDDCPMYIRVWSDVFENIDQDPRLFKLQETIAQDGKNLAIFRGEIRFNSYTNTNELTLSKGLSGALCQIF